MSEQETLSQDKRLVAITYIFLVVTFLSTGIFMEQIVGVNRLGVTEQVFNGGAPVEYVNGGMISSNPTKLKAIVKGSIYETGSNMTVYGACFDGDGYLLPETTALFTAWYPNGTIHTGPNASMFDIKDDFQGYSVNGTGRYGIHVTMGSTIGTYLTEMRCTYQDEWAVAFGEWQNPEWVVRIADTQASVTSMSNFLVNVSNDINDFRNETNNTLNDFRNETQINFDNLQTSLNVTIIGSNQDLSDELNELTHAITDVDKNRWVLDEKNPFYLLSSGIHMWSAVDMFSENNVMTASSDGYIATWDGESWTETQAIGYEWRGVSIMPADLPFAWIVGTNGSTAYYSINGNTPTLFPTGVSTALNDVKIFQQPNNPSGAYFGYVLGDDGVVYSTNDSGISWTTPFSVDAASHGRISKIVENYGANGQINGYMAMFGQGSKLAITDGVTVQSTIVAGTVKDVSMLYYDLGYAIVEDATNTKIYKFDGVNTTLDFTIEDPAIIPTGIVVLARNDVWVTTSDPSTFFHFDGRKWEYSPTGGYGEFVSVIVSFGGGNSSTFGVQDVVMSDTKNGYAVGTDGLILIFGQKYDLRLNKMTAFLEAQNASLTFKLDNVLNNVTYTQLWLNTTLYPLTYNIYNNTLEILYQLGILEAQINQTIALQNTTIGIVNETNADVKELLNRTSRIRAWVTQ